MMSPAEILALKETNELGAVNQEGEVSLDCLLQGSCQRARPCTVQSVTAPKAARVAAWRSANTRSSTAWYRRSLEAKK